MVLLAATTSNVAGNIYLTATPTPLTFENWATGGWTPIDHIHSGVTADITVCAAYRWWQSGDAAPILESDGADVMSAIIYRVSGANASPIDDSQATEFASGTEHSIGTVTATIANDLILALWAAGGIVGSYSGQDSTSTPDLTWTEDGDVNTSLGSDGTTMAAHSNVFTGTGDISAIHADCSGAIRGAGIAVLLKEAFAAGHRFFQMF